MVRRASSSPAPIQQSKSKTRAAPEKEKKPVSPPRLLVYHAGTPRIMFLGVLKFTAAIVFGLTITVTIPSSTQAGAPMWQVAGLTVSAVAYLVIIWYLTHPMVMWMHIKLPPNSVKPMTKGFLRNIPATTEVAVTTMGPLANARLSKVTLGGLQPTNRRFGLVNYVRDVRRENAERKWYQFRAVGAFKIEDGVKDPATRKPWLWYEIRQALENGKAAKTTAKKKPLVLHGLPRGKGKNH